MREECYIATSGYSAIARCVQVDCAFEYDAGRADGFD